mmetsp:Transcript_4886/g.10903  ORF Transcript_4886/g.10903 Transcript_4886/m.10903 type:complete len:324 (+) Transcript_4886:937-1908(+)
MRSPRMSIHQTLPTCSSKVAAQSEVRICQSFRRPSTLLVMSCMPLLRKQTRRTALVCPWKERMGVKSRRFHRRTSPSPDAEAMTWSMGEKATHQIPLLCPLHSPAISASGYFQMRTSLSRPPEAMSLLLGETTTSFTSLVCAMTVTLDFFTKRSLPPLSRAFSSCAALGSSQTFMVLSWLPLTSRSCCAPSAAAPGGAFGRLFGNDSAETAFAWPAKRQAQRHSVAPQMRMVWSLPPVAIQRPSLDTSQEITMSVWPIKSDAAKPWLFTTRGYSSLATQTKRSAVTVGPFRAPGSAGTSSLASGQDNCGMNCTWTISSLCPMM